MKKLITLLALPVFLTACGTVPPEWKEGDQSFMELAEQKPDEELCRKTKVSGSQFDKKVCMTRQKWAEMEQRAQENAAAAQRAGAQAIRSPQGAN